MNSYWLKTLKDQVSLALREAAYRVLCNHQQGSEPNILLYCNRRGGSTWLLNTLAAHPGCRYVGRPFLTAIRTRHAKAIPRTLRERMRESRGHLLSVMPAEEKQFRAFAERVLSEKIEIYPSLAFGEPYFQRVTERIVFQMTSGGPLFDWFSQNFSVANVLLLRHPITNSLSVQQAGWPPRLAAFVRDEAFCSKYLTGKQMDLLRKLVDGQNQLALHVAESVLHILAPYQVSRNRGNEAIIITSYEEMVLQPGATVARLAGNLNMHGIAPMLSQAARASRTVSSSTRGRQTDPNYVLRRWRKRVGPSEEQELLGIAHRLGVDAYNVGEDVPGDLRDLVFRAD